MKGIEGQTPQGVANFMMLCRTCEILVSLAVEAILAEIFLFYCPFELSYRLLLNTKCRDPLCDITTEDNRLGNL